MNTPVVRFGRAILISLLCAGVLRAQSYTFTLFAGSAPPIGSTDGQGPISRFNNPSSVAVDRLGNVFVCDEGNDTIRKITPDGTVSTFAGSPGQAGWQDGVGSVARFSMPFGIDVDKDGVVWVADLGNDVIRRISADGSVTTVAGNPGNPGSQDGTGLNAMFDHPIAIAAGSNGDVFVADRGNGTIRKIDSTAKVTTVAGKAGYFGHTDGTGGAALFAWLSGIATDTAGNLYVSDDYGENIRKIDPTAVVTTLAGVSLTSGEFDGSGAAATFSNPRGLVVDGKGNVFVADAGNDKIREIAPDGTTSTFAGHYPSGSKEGDLTAATFNFPADVALDSNGNMYVADRLNHSIRKVTADGQVTLLAGGGGNLGSADGTGADAQFNHPNGICYAPDGNLYVADEENATVRCVTADGSVTTYAGSPGVIGYLDDIDAKAKFGFPEGIAGDSSGILFVTDAVYNTVRTMRTDGHVYTLAGVPSTTGGSADGAYGTDLFNHPTGITADAKGNLYVADMDNDEIREVSPAGVVVTIAGSAGVPGATDGYGTDARFNRPAGIAVGQDGTIYVADTHNSTIRKIAPDRQVTTLAGLAGTTGSGDGLGSTARFFDPVAIALDPSGNLIVADFDNHIVREVTPDGRVTTIGGTAGSSGCAGGTGAAARFEAPSGVAINSSGALYITDNSNGVIFKGVLDKTPELTVEPLSYTVLPGGNLTFSASATGGGLNYQWSHDGVAVAGATDNILTLTNAQPADAGAYSLAVTNSAGTVTSTPAALSVKTTANIGRIINLSVRSTAGAGDQKLIVGFAISGSDTSGKPLLIRGIGPSLAQFGLTGLLPDPVLDLYTGSTLIAENDDWGGTDTIVSVSHQVQAFPLVDPASKDAVLYETDVAPGTHTAWITGKSDAIGLAIAEIYDATPPDTFTPGTPRLINVSARSEVGTGGNVLIAGFSIDGETAENVLIRGIGPTLGVFGLQGVLQDPKLELYSNNAVIAENDNWGGSDELDAAFHQVGAFGLSKTSKDAALLVTLPPGTYSAQVSGVGGTTGIGLVEVYEIP